MLVKELQEKVLEVSQLEWWLQNPTIKSFFLRSEATGDDNGNYFVEVENRSYRLTTDSDVLNSDLDHDDEYEMNSSFFDYCMHPDFSTKTYYPVDINESHYERIYRPYPTDAEIQARIDTILNSLSTQEELTELVLNTSKNSAGLVRG
jgi:hypothetical protein